MNTRISTNQIITRTAMLLALALIFQNLRLLPFLSTNMPYSIFIIGSLVNLVLYVAAFYTGLFGGIFIALVTPVVSLMQGHITLPVLVPVIFIGNALLVIAFYYTNKINKLLSVIIASAVKWAFLAFSVPYVLKAFVPSLKPAMLYKIAATFNIPQLITALIGGVFAILIIVSIKNKDN